MFAWLTSIEKVVSSFFGGPSMDGHGRVGSKYILQVSSVLRRDADDKAAAASCLIRLVCPCWDERRDKTTMSQNAAMILTKDWRPCLSSQHRTKKSHRRRCLRFIGTMVQAGGSCWHKTWTVGVGSSTTKERTVCCTTRPCLPLSMGQSISRAKHATRYHTMRDLRPFSTHRRRGVQGCFVSAAGWRWWRWMSRKAMGLFSGRVWEASI